MTCTWMPVPFAILAVLIAVPALGGADGATSLRGGAKQEPPNATDTCIGDGEKGCEKDRDCCNGLTCFRTAYNENGTWCEVDYGRRRRKDKCKEKKEKGCKKDKDCCDGLTCFGLAYPDENGTWCEVDYSRRLMSWI
eukprot:TRINITY_DN570_c0_g1_i1.p1 TRINITY_DN570_c0_g1~~TRINITY_DN570_c0_g1_i1.p1  ORF type:complete len:137 (-),score=14.04 TRINITY_DN570_c0_g1_i1:391-801(-)